MQQTIDFIRKKSWNVSGKVLSVATMQYLSNIFPLCDLHHTVASSRHQVDETLPILRTGQEVAHGKMCVLVFYQKAIAENCINYSVIQFC